MDADSGRAQAVSDRFFLSHFVEPDTGRTKALRRANQANMDSYSAFSAFLARVVVPHGPANPKRVRLKNESLQREEDCRARTINLSCHNHCYRPRRCPQRPERNAIPSN